MSSVKKTSEIVVAGLFSVAFVTLLFGANLKAHFWLIDDHSILTYMANAKSGIRDFFYLFDHSEISQFGNSTRYRPGYYALYILESLVWRDRPFFWYLCRLGMAAVFVFACLYVVRRAYGWLNGLLFTLLVFSYEFWTDIWSRLGPGEIYCALGFGLFAIAMERLLSEPRPHWRWSALLAVGVFIAAGAKENFIFLAVPLIVLGAILWHQARLARHVIASLAFSATYIGVIVLQLLLAFSKVRADYYANRVDVSSRFATLALAFDIPEFIAAVVLFAAAGLAYALLLGQDAWWGELRRRVGVLALIAVGAALILLTQVVFYNGHWPTNMRYDFPGKMVAPFLVVTVAHFADWHTHSRWPWISSVSVTALVFVVFTPLILVNIADLRAGADANVVRTLASREKILHVAATLRENSGVPLILESFHPLDYESLLSVKVFLRHEGVENPLLIRVNGYTTAEQKSDLDRFLAAGVLDWAKADEPQVSRVEECFSVSFLINPHGKGNRTAPEHCTSLAQF